MHLAASNATAALAGAWSALGFGLFEAWMEHHSPSSASATNLLWFVALAVFLFLPGYLFVIGTGNAPFGRRWFLDTEERARYAVVAKRMLVWFLAAGVVMTILSFVPGLGSSNTVAP
jgi:hypothetical protein